MGAHIIDNEFQSDKYPSTPRGKVPLSVKDPMAQNLLWEYAQRRRAVDAEFADDLETCLRAAEYEPPPSKLFERERETDFQPDWYKFQKLSEIFRHRPSVNVYWNELRRLLREAREDAIRFIYDVKSEELKKAHNDGVNDTVREVLTILAAHETLTGLKLDTLTGSIMRLMK